MQGSPESQQLGMGRHDMIERVPNDDWLGGWYPPLPLSLFEKIG